MIDKVLLIDDDEITLMICEMVMICEGFANEVLKFKNGYEGIDYFERLKNDGMQELATKAPALIFLDLNMPFMNGWEFLEVFANTYSEIFPAIKICILTSSVDPLDLTQSKIYDNVIGFINKPLTTERLNELKENENIAHFFSTS